MSGPGLLAVEALLAALDVLAVGGPDVLAIEAANDVMPLDKLGFRRIAAQKS